nr:5-formyltetrahydrofolate cyclo-ligase [Allomuricauda sp.]
MLKHELRKKYRGLRNALGTEEISIKSVHLTNNILTIPMWDFFYFHVFLSITENKEVDTHPLITLLQGKDKSLVVPKVTGDHSMTQYLLQDNTALKLNKWNIPEPVEGIEVDESKIDVVFVPLLAYDVFGNRVGYGKGFYDNLLQKCRPETLKIGLSFYPPEKNRIEDINTNDVRLDYCVTPEEVYKF